MNEMVASAHVTEMVPVGVMQPGMMPTKLDTRMKKNMVAKNGTWRLKSWPMTCSPMSLRTNW